MTVRRIPIAQRRFAALIGLVLLHLFAGQSHAQTSRPTHADTWEIDAIDALPTNGPSLPAVGATGRRERIVDWVSLTRFFAPGLIVAGSIGISGSIVGTFALLRREALVALAIPQVVAVGAAIGMRLGWPTLPPAMVAVAASVTYFVADDRREAGSRRSAFAAPSLYIAGLCVSFLVIANGGQHVEELQSLFTGIDVAVTPTQAALAAPVLLIAGGVCALLWRRWLLIAQAPATAALAGIRVSRYDAFFLALLAVVLLIGTSAQGAVMVLAMLFLPPAIVTPWSHRLPTALAAGIVTSLACLTVAFFCSVKFEWPLSHSVGGVAFAALLTSHLARCVLHLSATEVTS